MVISLGLVLIIRLLFFRLLLFLEVIIRELRLMGLFFWYLNMLKFFGKLII